MKIVNITAMILAIGAFLFITGCATTQSIAPVATQSQSNTATQTEPKKSAAKKRKHVERELIDWKGAAINQDVPMWVGYAIDSNYDELSKLKELDGKMIFIAENRGYNLNILKSWTNNYDIQGGFSRGLSNYVVGVFGGALEGSLNNKEDESFLNDLVGSFSKTKITGLSKKMDYWVQNRIIDNDANTTDDIYQYFVVYTMDIEDYRKQVDKMFGTVEPKTEKQTQAKSDARDAALSATVLSLTEEAEEKR